MTTTPSEPEERPTENAGEAPQDAPASDAGVVDYLIELKKSMATQIEPLVSLAQSMTKSTEPFRALAESAASQLALSQSLLGGAEWQKTLSKIAADSLEWRKTLEEVRARPMPVLTSIGPSPVVEATLQLRNEVREISSILVTTAEQIGSMVAIGSVALEGLLRVEGMVGRLLEESGKLRGTIVSGQEATEKAGKTLTKLTVVIAFLTLVLVALTVVLVFRANGGGTHDERRANEGAVLVFLVLVRGKCGRPATSMAPARWSPVWLEVSWAATVTRHILAW